MHSALHLDMLSSKWKQIQVWVANGYNLEVLCAIMANLNRLRTEITLKTQSHYDGYSIIISFVFCVCV